MRRTRHATAAAAPAPALPPPPAPPAPRSELSFENVSESSGPDDCGQPLGPGWGGGPGWLGSLRGAAKTLEDVLNDAVGEVLSVELEPAVRLKLRKRTPWATLGADLQPGAPTHRAGVDLILKKGDADAVLWKVRSTAAASATGAAATRACEEGRGLSARGAPHLPAAHPPALPPAR